MIHDNNCAGGEITADDLLNGRDTGKSIPDFITDKSGRTQQLSADTDRRTAAEDKLIISMNSYSHWGG